MARIGYDIMIKKGYRFASILLVYATGRQQHSAHSMAERRNSGGGGNSSEVDMLSVFSMSLRIPSRMGDAEGAPMSREAASSKALPSVATLNAHNI